MARRGNGEGTIFKRADGRWAATINLGYQDGKRKRKTYYAATRKEVREQLAVALRSRQQGIGIATDRVPSLLRWRMLVPVMLYVEPTDKSPDLCPSSVSK